MKSTMIALFAALVIGLTGGNADAGGHRGCHNCGSGGGCPSCQNGQGCSSCNGGCGENCNCGNGCGCNSDGKLHVPTRGAPTVGYYEWQSNFYHFDGQEWSKMEVVKSDTSYLEDRPESKQGYYIISDKLYYFDGSKWSATKKNNKPQQFTQFGSTCAGGSCSTCGTCR